MADEASNPAGAGKKKRFFDLEEAYLEAKGVFGRDNATARDKTAAGAKLFGKALFNAGLLGKDFIEHAADHGAAWAEQTLSTGRAPDGTPLSAAQREKLEGILASHAKRKP
jgi:hypothetical protein